MVGAGVVGLLAAVECVLAGHRVSLVDQAQIPNPASTSSDDSRAVRTLHPGDPDATAAAASAHRRWLELQRLLGVGFYRQVGVLTSLPAEEVDDALTLLRSVGVEAQGLTPAALAQRLPHLVFAPGTGAVLEPQAGVVLAEQALAAAAGWLRDQPTAEVRERAPVTRVDHDNGRVELADGSTVTADLVLVAAGPWSRDLLGAAVDSALVMHRQTVLYCQVPSGLRAEWARTPAVGRLGHDGRGWLTPPGRSMKVSSAGVCREVDVLGGRAAEPAWRRRLEEMLGCMLAGAQRYTVLGARDFHYLADRVTGGAVFTQLRSAGAPVLAYPACGGGGFKTAPLVARRAAQWAC